MVQLLIRFLEQSLIISRVIPVQKAPYQNLFVKQHIVYPVLQMRMPSNFDWHNMIHSTEPKVNRKVLGVSYDANKNYL